MFTRGVRSVHEGSSKCSREEFEVFTRGVRSVHEGSSKCSREEFEVFTGGVQSAHEGSNMKMSTGMGKGEFSNKKYTYHLTKIFPITERLSE